MPKLRISAISYLNTAPLMWDFEHGPAGSKFDISYTVPSQCAQQLKAGTADIGIIPAAAYATVPDLRILPGVAIASRQAVRSILLVSKVSLDRVKSIAVDTSSLTSVALTKVLFARWWGGGRTFVPAAPDLKTMLQQHDAALIIGDPALKIDRTRYLAYDLAEEWVRLTGKPFVFAFWAVRRDAITNASDTDDLATMFQQSRDHGLEPQNLVQIASEWASKLDLTEQEVSSYLTENIHYHFDAPCLDGLSLFLEYANQCGALPPVAQLEFLQPTSIHS